VTELERALEDAPDGGAPHRWRWRRLLSRIRWAPREQRKYWLLTCVALALLLATAIFFAAGRGLVPSWTQVTARAASLLERGPWNRALAKYKDLVALYHFGEAAATIRNVRLIGAYFKPAKQVAEKRAQLLFDWKNTLVGDLNRVHFSGTLTDKSGTQYTGIASATDESLSMKLPYGIARVKWEQLSPQELLAVSKSFIDPGSRDAADRQWRCAVFASETGQPEAASQLGYAAAKTKPEYKAQISVLFPGSPQTP